MNKRFSLLLLLCLLTPPTSACAQNNGTSAPIPASPPSPMPQNIAPELPPPVPAADQLTLRQAVMVGLRDNPQTAAAHYAVLSAKENYNSQKAPINPTVQYAALNNTVAPADYVNGFSQGTNYSTYVTLETNGAQHFRATQAREQYHQAQFDASTTHLSLKLSIINAYINLQVANRTLEVEQKVYDNLRQLSELTQKRFEAGAGTDADARRARIAYVQELQNLITDVAGVNSARSTLNAQLGRPQNAPINVAEPLTYKPMPRQDLATLMKLAEQHRPELQSAQANLRSLQAVPGLERSAYYPNVVLGRDFGSDTTLGIGVSVPLDLGSIHGAVNKAKADVKSQEAQVELERQNIDQDVKSSYINLDAAQRQVDSYEDGGILKESETLLNQTKQAYSLGANTLLDVITAENTYRSVESTYYSAIGTYVQATYALQHAIGDLPDALPGITTTGKRTTSTAIGTTGPNTVGGEKKP